MGFFTKKKEEKSKDEEVTTTKVSSQTSATKKQASPATSDRKKTSDASPTIVGTSVLLGPHVTEKSHTLVSAGKYVFRVAPRATKRRVKHAVAQTYNVDVVDVHMVKIPRKRRTVKYNRGYQSAGKKAIVTLKKGETIALFETA